MYMWLTDIVSGSAGIIIISMHACMDAPWKVHGYFIDTAITMISMYDKGMSTAPLNMALCIDIQTVKHLFHTQILSQIQTCQ